jgi:undecaprenyl diphosphate synthase
VIGDIDRLSPKMYSRLMETINVTGRGSNMTLIVALSYSSKWEITQACRNIAAAAKDQKLEISEITEDTVAENLTTAGFPEPELMIRTSGEKRISNFLLWQLAYSELYFTEKLWPDFGKEDFYKAVANYQKRERRFGKTSEQLAENN